MFLYPSLLNRSNYCISCLCEEYQTFFKKKEKALINLHTPHRQYLPQTGTLKIIFRTMRFSLSKDVASSSRAWYCLFALLHSFSPKSLLENPRLLLLLHPAHLIRYEELTPLHLRKREPSRSHRGFWLSPLHDWVFSPTLQAEDKTLSCLKEETEFGVI